MVVQHWQMKQTQVRQWKQSFKPFEQKQQSWAVGAEDGAGVPVMVHGTAWSVPDLQTALQVLVQQLVQTTMTHQVPLQQTLHFNLELKSPVEEECTSVHLFLAK